MNTPMHLTDEEINNLVERGMLPPKHPDVAPVSDDDEHPYAKYLYRRFQAGSAILSKSDAYNIGNELDRLYRAERELLATSRETVRVAKAAVETLSKL